jgi:hypothetical protein
LYGRYILCGQTKTNRCAHRWKESKDIRALSARNLSSSGKTLSCPVEENSCDL